MNWCLITKILHVLPLEINKIEKKVINKYVHIYIYIYF